MMLSSQRRVKPKKIPIVKKKQNPSTLKCNQSLNDTCLPNKSIHISTKNNNITTSINHSMRAILVDWIMQVCSEFEFQRVTFHLSINIVDKYLNHTDITKERFQLLGTTALFIAHKIEEVDVLQIRMFQDATNGGFNSQDIIEMEQEIYLVLKWKVSSLFVYHALTEMLKKWDDYVQQTDYSNSRYYCQNNNYQTILNMLDYLTIHHISLQPNKLILALLYTHLLLSNDSKSLLKTIFNLFLKNYKTSVKNLKQQINFVQFLIPSLHPFCVTTQSKLIQQYISYIRMYSQYLNR